MTASGDGGRRRLQGLVPVLATPFLPDESLDEEGLHRLVAFQLACGVGGVAVFGMASEGFTLTAAERRRVLAVVGDEVAGRVPVVAGVNATSVHTAVEQTELAAECGADMAMVLPPFLVRPAGEALVDFFHAVADASAGLGVEVMVQDAPGVTGVSMSADVVAAACRHPAVTAVKIEAPPTPVKVAAVTAALAAAPAGHPVAVLGGQNAFFLLEELAAGAVATMPACEFVDRLGPVLTAEDAGDARTARHCFDPLLPLIRFGMQPGLAWAVHKQVLVRRGVIAHATVRSPALPLDQRTADALDDLLADLTLADYASVVGRAS